RRDQDVELAVVGGDLAVAAAVRGGAGGVQNLLNSDGHSWFLLACGVEQELADGTAGSHVFVGGGDVGQRVLAGDDRAELAGRGQVEQLGQRAAEQLRVREAVGQPEA